MVNIFILLVFNIYVIFGGFFILNIAGYSCYFLLLYFTCLCCMILHWGLYHPFSR